MAPWRRPADPSRFPASQALGGKPPVGVCRADGARAHSGGPPDPGHLCGPCQVVLCNPICGVGYALTVWRFFRDRTEEEEISLIHFFGDEYLEYKKRVPTGLPFINGVKVGL